jgi:hypothetical protein
MFGPGHSAIFAYADCQVASVNGTRRIAEKKNRLPVPLNIAIQASLAHRIREVVRDEELILMFRSISAYSQNARM